ncbi:hypothetical protein ASPZODRAFT_74687 [Penicilliopsis zonata CBS 506.65]|uniref:Uncharacterized protein n=1 Tax=Penicilliopsis zonata CBS 506.65 TaxID=1073090 RepID=A0A1L9S814_9EURO|nr:hypothetical protein ASPZODRAFT_74687 [Penicilliopsis zonata CBS 506.65]OJJ43308.1 hypothetical protein ASPZODRAFT_74687 [Penicilliopsis zonata CBS 506.65]
MAEPEDLEEDLFADLYEADEKTNHAVPGTDATTAAEPAFSTPGAFYADNNGTQDYGNTQFEAEENRGYDQPYDGGHQNGAGGLDTAPINSEMGTAVDSEPQGTGIKEDG